MVAACCANPEIYLRSRIDLIGSEPLSLLPLPMAPGVLIAIDVDFTHNLPKPESHVVRSLEELIGDPLSIETRLRGVSSQILAVLPRGRSVNSIQSTAYPLAQSCNNLPNRPTETSWCQSGAHGET